MTDGGQAAFVPCIRNYLLAGQLDLTETREEPRTETLHKVTHPTSLLDSIPATIRAAAKSGEAPSRSLLGSGQRGIEEADSAAR
jgi:hypothetical protein